MGWIKRILIIFFLSIFFILGVSLSSCDVPGITQSDLILCHISPILFLGFFVELFAIVFFFVKSIYMRSNDQQKIVLVIGVLFALFGLYLVWQMYGTYFWMDCPANLSDKVLIRVSEISGVTPEQYIRDCLNRSQTNEMLYYFGFIAFIAGVSIILFIWFKTRKNKAV